MSGQKEFKAAAHKALEHAIEWRRDGTRLPAYPTASPEQLRKLFDIGLPENGAEGEQVIEQLIKAAEQGLVNNTHPNFYAWVQGSSHPVGVAADILTSAWGQNAGLYQTAPAAAIAEEVAGKWLLDLLQLPSHCSFAFTTGATMASFIGLSAARSEVLHRLGYDLEQDGLSGAPTIHLFLGEEAHATVFSDLRYLGFGRRNLVFVNVDNQGRMLQADLEKKLKKHVGAKIVILQAGHINSGAFDPFSQLLPLCQAHGAWVHVDGAFGLWARAVPEFAALTHGLELADSWTVDGHKWLQIPYDSGFSFVKHPIAHRRAMDISASYLSSQPHDGRSPTQYGPELSRRARGFTVWAVLQVLGRQGVTEMISRHHRCARQLALRLQDHSGIRILNQVVLNQLAIAFGHDNDSLQKRDALTTCVVRNLQQENKHFVQGANWKNQAILRISVISQSTDTNDIDALADSIICSWEAVQSQQLELSNNKIADC